MESFVLAPAWAHLVALAVAAGLMVAAAPARRAVANTSIPRIAGVLAAAQVLSALAALYVTGAGGTGDLGCRIGLAGYGLDALAFVVALALTVMVALRVRAYGGAAALRLVLFLCAASLLTAEVFLIHARALSFCVGSV